MELTEPTLTKIIGAIMLSGFIGVGVTLGGWSSTVASD